MQHMPRTGPRRPIVGVRMSDTGIEALDAIAAETATKRSDVIRALLAEALQAPAVVRAAKRRLREHGPDVNAKRR